MKKARIIIMFIVLLFLLSSCTPLEKHGIENFNMNTCSVSLTANLFPSENFLSLYKYENGDYHYCDENDWAWGYVTAFACLKYTPEVYGQAKSFCMQNFTFCEDHQYDYNDYHFAEHLCYTEMDEKGDRQIACQYPKQFNMFAYHDEECTLIFLGYYNGEPDAQEKQLAISEFTQFLTEVYPDIP